MTNILKELHEHHQGKISDKWLLYLEEGDRLLSPYHQQPINLLEIGIQNGGSLEVWGKYFVKAKKIIGCDINPACNQLEYEDKRINVIVGDCNTEETEQNIVRQSSDFDIIIDDGSHKSSDIIKSFARYFPYLSDGGLYIIEDLHCSYWEYFEGSLFDPFSSISFFKRIADIINYEHWRNNKPRNYLLDNFAKKFDIHFDNLDLARIHSIEFINSLCIVKKLPPAKNVIGNRLIVGNEEKVTTSWHKHNGTSVNDITINILNDENLDVFNLTDKIERLNQSFSDKEADIVSLRQQIAKITEQTEQTINEQKTLLENKEILIGKLDQEAFESNQQVLELKHNLTNLNEKINDLNEKILEHEKEAKDFHQSSSEKNDLINNLNQNLLEREKQIEEINGHLDNKLSQINSLQNIITEQTVIISNFQNSNSWKLTAPLRNLRNLKKGVKEQSLQISNQITSTYPGAQAFFTICSKNFLAHARVLYKSIKPHYPDSRFFVVLCDKVDGYFNPSDEPFEFIYLEDLNLPNLEDMANRYNITEFNTAVKPFSFLHLMDKYKFNSVTYLDPDLLFVDKMEELDQMLSEGVEAILTPHILEPSEHNQINDQTLLLHGIHNLGFLALRKSEKVTQFLSWWSRRLEHECVINLEQGLFVDQKWADLLPSFIPNTKLIHHPGYNVAYWNLTQRQITKVNDKWFSNQQPLRFIHFSGNNLDDPNTFSRHTSQVTLESIGDLRHLFEYYREQVFKEGHNRYRSYPYAYSWNGKSGINLHTPSTFDRSEATDNTPPTENNSLYLNNEPANSKKSLSRLSESISVASNHYGGILPATQKAIIALRQKGWKHFKTKVHEVVKPEYTEYLKTFDSSAPDFSEHVIETTSSDKKKLLYVDWGIPKPDIDAGSHVAAQLLKIFVSLDYQVTFVPAGLKYEEGYFEALVNDGINVLCYPQIKSFENWLRTNAKEFDVAVLSRAPVVWQYLSLIKETAPNLKLIFNTADLHHLRELRHAELVGDEKLRQAALVTKEQEFDLIKQCDLTLIVSTEELYIVRETVPSAPLAILPLIFEDIPGAVKSFEEKQDILFIGSFAHLPNIDAVIYFAEEVFPLVQKLIPDIRFKVIGADPPKEIQRLSKNPAIEICGFVKDLKPIYEDIRLSIAPLRFGAGIKGKIGMSFCYGVPCIGTKIAAEGMGLENGRNILIGETPEEFADAIYKAYSNPKIWQQLSEGGHQFAKENYSVETIQTLMKNLLVTVVDGWKPIDSLVEINNWDSLQNHQLKMKNEYNRRLEVEIDSIPSDKSESFKTTGFCCICKQETEFITSFLYSCNELPDGRKMPNWREHMQCVKCGFINRLRAAIHALHTNVTPSPNSRIYLTEQVTPTYEWFRANYQYVTGSEYLGEEIEFGEVKDNIRNEDIMNLTFSDASFDYVLSFDVLEHVPYPKKAFSEIYRILADQGIFLFTVPFSYESPKDIIRAKMDKNGKIKHLLPPEFHGNPVNTEAGVLCYRYFGWEMLDQLREIGFTKVRGLAYWSKEQGYLGKEQYLFIAEKSV